MKTLYIIPGYTETTRRKPYQALAKIAREKGYAVLLKDVDWKLPLSLQKFVVPKDAVLFGFSLGAILAHLVAQDFPCRLLLQASMTPHTAFKPGKDKNALVKLLGKKFVDDAASALTHKTKAKKTLAFYGELESGVGDITIPHAHHELTDEYINIIGKLL